MKPNELCGQPSTRSPSKAPTAPAACSDGHAPWFQEAQVIQVVRGAPGGVKTQGGHGTPSERFPTHHVPAGCALCCRVRDRRPGAPGGLAVQRNPPVFEPRGPWVEILTTSHHFCGTLGKPLGLRLPFPTCDPYSTGPASPGGACFQSGAPLTAQPGLSLIYHAAQTQGARRVPQMPHHTWTRKPLLCAHAVPGPSCG